MDMKQEHWGAQSFLDHRAERLTLLEKDGRNGATEHIARRTVERANGLEFGMEGFTAGNNCSRSAIRGSYVNVGDTYDGTMVLVGGEWAWTSWGDAYEAAEEEYSEDTGEFRCYHCSTWTEYTDDDGRGLCCGAVDPSGVDVDDILEGAARALFLSAYADAAEEMMCPACEAAEGEDCFEDCTDVDRVLEYVPRFDLEMAGPREDWDDVAPETPEAAWDSARRLLSRTGKLHGPDVIIAIKRLCAEWVRAGGSGEERFGHCLAMQALGHGVGLIDDVRPDADYVGPDLPSWEAHFDPGAGFTGGL